MKILLQHALTFSYLSRHGGWTERPEEALDFRHSQKVIDFSHEYGLRDVQIAVKFLDSEFDSVFPIPLAGAAADVARA